MGTVTVTTNKRKKVRIVGGRSRLRVPDFKRSPKTEKLMEENEQVIAQYKKKKA